jgi:MFS family permease
MAILVVACAVQGVGAGAVTPVSMTVVGDRYAPAERARIQSLFGAIWGVAGRSGPLLGGLVVEVPSWRRVPAARRASADGDRDRDDRGVTVRLRVDLRS